MSRQLGRAEFSECFIRQVLNYQVLIPNEVTHYYMKCSGLLPNDEVVTKLIAIAAQKFISDILLDAREKARLSQTPAQRRVAKDKYTLTPELLEDTLREHGIECIRAPYHH